MTVLSRKKMLSISGAMAMLISTLVGIAVTKSAGALPQTVRINSGGPGMVDYDGRWWDKDSYYIGGYSHAVNQPIAGTNNAPLYQTERWGASGYTIPIASGTYSVVLRFAEINPDSGTRVQTIKAEDQVLLQDYNTAQRVGPFTAQLLTFRVVVKDDQLDLDFSAASNSTSIAAIEVHPAPGSSTTPTTTTPLRSTTTIRPAPLPSTTTTPPRTTPPTTARPTTTAAPVPIPVPVPVGSASSPSGQAMPVGNLSGWTQTLTDDFNTDVSVGSFPGNAYNAKWDVYPDGWLDTAAQHENGNGRYFPSKVLSVDNGMLNMDLHTENGVHMVSAPMPTAGPGYGQLYGRFSARMRADAVPGYKTAWLLWPNSERWPDDGEIDFPEGDLVGNVHAFAHFASANGGQDAFNTSAKYTDWHTYTIEWIPGRVTFILDGQVVGTSTRNVPSKPMHWVLQTETCFGYCQPTASARGNLQIDWVTVYSYNG